MSKAQHNYSTTEKAALAVVLALKNFRPYVYGHHTIICTDCHPLLGIFKGTNYQGRMTRWALMVQEYSPDFKYVPRKLSSAADSLNSLVALVSTFPTIESKLCRNQQEGSLWSRVRDYLIGKITIPEVKLLVPLREPFLQNDLCRDAHLGSTTC